MKQRSVTMTAALAAIFAAIVRPAHMSPRLAARVCRVTHGRDFSPPLRLR